MSSTTSVLMNNSNTFVVEDMLSILKEAVESSIQNSPYQHSKVPQWTSSIIDSSLKKIQELQKPFKYIVTCVIFQKTGAGFHLGSSCSWDPSTDGSCSYRWENKSMYCIINVFGCKV
ncbi:cytoplasmic dynein light chain [Tieghemostelium lacteum]|uniref:Cytoplasmic dynein light chain n=1 Tax=Tieghemostelium lacteum TaxID=361077 RepID=A0A151ZRX6_TIELA|nr:cytoplasmic dynein light chain [Tieghemostelium lacteum]|eukprot:KYQ96680.1 cytoplasmic dynein light chain [Tieghemostelium lacteum]